MQVGEVFTRSDIETQPCVHCGAPAVALDDPRAMHFEVADNGARTAWPECFTVVRGRRGDRRKYLGTTAEVAA
ncbi:hypothetical protein SEA_MASK_73 [Mycobacterium phage Mask]|nr:hypothetical protein SEA_SEJANUS_72 [Mycobacterium phage Sejanus]UVT31606.1 hypothetical protein SEA_MASK_73 [Mycobacterium phage Mask]